MAPGQIARNSVGRRLLIVAGVLLVSTSVLSDADARTIWVDGPRVRLSDLGRDVASDVDLGPAPPPGRVRRIPRSALPHGATGLAAHGSLTVRTRQQTIGCDRFKTLLRAALRGQIGPPLKIEQIDCPRDLQLAAGDVEMTARLTSGQRRAGRLTAAVTLRAGGWPETQIVTSLQVDGQIPVLLAARDVPAGVPLQAGDISIDHRRATQVGRDTLSSVAMLTGMRTRSTLLAGQPIRRGQLTPVPLIERGARVTVSVVLPGLRLRSVGEAREAGRRGERITVLCASSHKLLKARVVSAREVRVDL